MSGELTARDIIGAHQRLSKGSCSCGQKFTPDGRILDEIAAEHLLAMLDAAGLEVTEKPNPLLDLRDAEGNYLGKQGTTHEHRTVGDYRAWSHDAHEWCYPADPCHLCKEMAHG